MSEDDFKVLAIIAARNEADVIPQLLDDLVRQNVCAYLIDDGSSDDTVAVASRWLNKGLLGIEQRPDTGIYHWSEILKRKEELAMELPATWFIHQDADEFHESPWPNLDLRDAIRHVHDVGYNAIDFRLLNFRPLEAGGGVPDDVRSALTHFELPEAWDEMQIKCWKNTGVRVDLHSSGGHAADFNERIVCPIAFLTRHYPIRSQAHGRQKVIQDRRPRFSPEERRRGWHIQYDDLDRSDFVWQGDALTLYDPIAVKKELMTVSHDALRLESVKRAVEDLKQTQHAEAMEHSEELARLRHLIATTQQHLETSRRELAATHLEVQIARSETEEARRTAELSRASSDEARRALEGGLATLASELQAVYDSHSWRLSRPLRTVYGWFLKTRKNFREDK
jgi:hypothetical protein